MSLRRLASSLSKIQLARLALAVILVVGTGFAIRDRLDRAQAAGLERVHFEAIEANRRVGILFEAARTVLDSVSEYVEATTTGALSLDARLDRLLDRSVGGPSILAGAIVQDRTGLIIAAGEPRTGVGLRLPDLDFFRQALAARQTGYHVGSPFESAILGTTLVPIAKGIRDAEGQTVGVVSVGLRMSMIQAALAPAIPTADARSRLWRRDGFLLASSADDAVEIARFYPDLPLFSAKEAGSSGTFVAHSPLTREVRLSAWRDDSIYPFFVSTGANRAKLLEDDYLQSLGLAAFACLALALLLLTVVLVDRERRNTSAALAEKQKALQIKTMFLANMSHEFRTPLNAISGYLQMLKMGVYGGLDARQTKAIDDVSFAAGHLATLTENLLDLSRIEAGRTVLEIEDADVGALIGEASALVAPQASARDVRVEVVGGGEPLPKVRCDPLRARQVLVNLLANAVRHSPPGGVVGVQASTPAGATVRIVVMDRGPGFGPGPLDRFFEPFASRDPFVTHKGGTGLGLSLSRALARAQGGDVTLANRDDGGAIVAFDLPVAP